MERRLLRVCETAIILGEKESRIYDLIRQGILPACHLGRQVRIDSKALEGFIENGGKALPGGWKRDDSCG